MYVDKLRNWGWKLGPSCHMIADTNEELHEFAAKLGMKRSWFQASASGPHYDLVRSKRDLAVRLGAVELDDRAFHQILEKWRKRAVAAVRRCKTEAERVEVRRRLFR